MDSSKDQERCPGPQVERRDRRLSSEEWDGKAASEYVCPRCHKHFENGEFW